MVKVKINDVKKSLCTSFIINNINIETKITQYFQSYRSNTPRPNLGGILNL